MKDGHTILCRDGFGGPAKVKSPHIRSMSSGLASSIDRSSFDLI